jgi:transcriptional antiterminator Rof (Rho-off)
MQTMDNHLVDNQLWLEKGVNYSADATDAVTKATKSDNPRDELLKVGRDDAAAYLRSARKPGREV